MDLHLPHRDGGLRGRSRLAALVTGLLALVLAACGGGEDRTKAHVRLVNASAGYASLDLRMGDRQVQGGVAYGASANYVDVDPEDDDGTIHRTGSPTALVTFTAALARDRHYTVLAYGNEGALRHLLIDDNVGQADSGRTTLRVINAAPDAGNLDVYLTASADELATAVPLASAVVYGAGGTTLTADSGTWRLRVTGAGLKSDLRLDVPALALGSREVATLVLTPGGGGVLVSALLVVQHGGIASHAVTHARVRAVAGVAASGAVAASVDGTALMNGVASPAVGAYVLVPAGAPTVAVAVNGTAVGVPAANLAAGGDYSLLVFGDAATPTVAWVSDDNALPDAGQARVRLVNAVAGLAGPASMTVDLLPVAENVAAGTASAPALVTPATAAAVSVGAAGSASALFAVPEQSLVSGANYSVFVLGVAGAVSGGVIKDR